MHAIMRQLRRAALLSGGTGPSDAQLLESFLGHREEAAFEALVRRHGPMVLAVCQRVTGNAHDAEDAFQATFLVLVRKAGSLRSRGLLPGWLYRVAYRTALNTRAMKKKRREKEQQAAQEPRTETIHDGVPEELLARLDEALNRLPDRYRLPVVLCELQGHSRKEAAQLLGLPSGTVSWRLAHARKLLAQRLARYGTMLSAGAVGVVLSQNGARAVPVALVRAVTLQALATGAVPVPIQALTEGVLKAMLLSKLKIVWGMTLAAVVGAGAVGLMYRPAVAADPTPSSSGRVAHATADELDELRLEIAALRKGLQATREHVKILENQVATLRSQRSGPANAGADAEGMGQMMQRMMQQSMGRGAAGNQAGGNPGAATIENAYQDPKPYHTLKGSGVGTPAYQNPYALAGPKDTGIGNPGQPAKEPNGLAGAKPQAGPQQSGSAKSPREAPRVDVDGAKDLRTAQYNSRLPGHKESQMVNPLTAAQEALKEIRKNPANTEAADRLERALKRLEMERANQGSGAKP